MDIEQIVMDITIQSGEAMGCAHEALSKANEGNFSEADKI